MFSILLLLNLNIRYIDTMFLLPTDPLGEWPIPVKDDLQR